MCSMVSHLSYAFTWDLAYLSGSAIYLLSRCAASMHSILAPACA